MIDEHETQNHANFLYPASYSNKFTRSWKVGNYIYFMIDNEVIKVLNIPRPASIMVPTHLKDALPSSPCLSHGLRRMAFQNHDIREEIMSMGYRKYYELASPFMKAKRGTYKNVKYLDIKSFYFAVHQQLYPYFNPKGVSDMKTSKIILTKYQKERTGYDARNYIDSLFTEKKNENTHLDKAVEQISKMPYGDNLDKSMVKKSRNLMSFGCFVEYNRRESKMTALHSLVPYVAEQIMIETEKQLKSFYSDTDCFMLKGKSFNPDHALSRAVTAVNKKIFHFDLLDPEAFKFGEKGSYDRMHILGKKYYIWEKGDEVSWTFSGLPTKDHLPITSMAVKDPTGWKTEMEYLPDAINAGLNGRFDFEDFYFSLPKQPMVAMRFYYMSHSKSPSNFVSSNPHLIYPTKYPPQKLFSRFFKEPELN